MKNYFRIIATWADRMRLYGLRNTVILKKNLKRNRVFSIRVNDREFYLRGKSVDFDVINSILKKGEYDLDTGIEPEVIVDAGANIGASTLYFRMRYPGSVIYAIEPEGSNFDLLTKNTAAYSDVYPENCAVWYENSDLVISNPDAEKYAFRMNEAGKAGNIIRGFTIDELMKRWGLTRIDILKMDIEGAEKGLFELPGIPWMKKVRVLIVELHEVMEPGTVEAFRRAINSIDCTVTQKGENFIVINNGFGNE